MEKYNIKDLDDSEAASEISASTDQKLSICSDETTKAGHEGQNELIKYRKASTDKGIQVSHEIRKSDKIMHPSFSGTLETGYPEIGKPETRQSENEKSETGKSETGKSETGKSETGKSETGKSEIGKTGRKRSRLEKRATLPAIHVDTTESLEQYRAKNLTPSSAAPAFVDVTGFDLTEPKFYGMTYDQMREFKRNQSSDMYDFSECE